MQAYTTNLVHSLVKVASSALVLSSIGFGAVFAFKASIHGGIILAGLAVLMAAALKAIKPLAIAQAFQAFGNWSLGRGLALLFLGLIAVAYSITSELSLMSASRGDLAAEQAQARSSQTMAKDAYERARAELATLKPSEIEAVIARQSANGCGVNGNVSGKWVCPVPTALLSELSRAKRRSELEAVLQTNAAQVTSGPAVASADPGSVNLATYLGALGLTVKPEAVAQWLALVPVLALEAGCALAGLLISAVRASEPQAPKRQKAGNATPLPTERDKVAGAIVDHLKANGGAVRGSHRVLGAKLGANRNTINRALHSLAASGVVALSSSKAGSVLRLGA
jgi:hypothetical protein